MGIGYAELWKQLSLFVDKKIDYYQKNNGIIHDRKHEALGVLTEIKRFMEAVDKLTVGW